MPEVRRRGTSPRSSSPELVAETGVPMSVSARGRGIPILVAGILVAAGATASVLPSAAAVTVAPPGTRVLASGPSGFPDRIDVVGADAQWVVFANEDQSGLGP
jgi:hypothetical protein